MVCDEWVTDILKRVIYSALGMVEKDCGGRCLYVIHPWPEAIWSKDSQRVAINNHIHTSVFHGPTGGKHN